MHVVATAGHVDHGKSTLVQALTGSDPDRLEEEHRRGLSIQLGYCWTALPGVGDVAFVDVPGHERFIATMLSGIGPVPAVLFVVAADDPWMPQAAEHLAALDALGVSHGILVVTRADLAEPAPALERARHELAKTSLAGVPALAVSARTGLGMDALRTALVDMVGSLPPVAADADVRLWVDRCFTVKGAGTVVTGTLPAGRVAVGDSLALGGADSAGAGTRLVRVRSMQSLGRPVQEATGVARVALNVAGSDVDELDRSSVLVTPGAWLFTRTADVRVSAAEEVPEQPLLHIGATSVPVRFRRLGGDVARLALDRPLPLRVGDRALLRDPGSRRVWGMTVLDPAPPALRRRRGAPRERADALAGADGHADLVREVERRGMVLRRLVRRIGVEVPEEVPEGVPGEVRDGLPQGAPEEAARRQVVAAGEWLLSRSRADELVRRMRALVTAYEEQAPLERGMPVGALTKALGLESHEIVQALVAEPLRVADGRVTARRSVVLPEALERSLAALAADLADAPFAAPTADRLRELRLDPKAVAAAAKAERLLRVADGIVLMPDAVDVATSWLSELPQPFTTSEARQRLGTSRRVVLPLLSLLDRLGRTRRLPDDRREVR